MNPRTIAAQIFHTVYQQWLQLRLSETVFREVRTYTMFIGYERSGHSLIGSLLDAHPDMVIAHELDALRFIDAGYTRNQLFHLILRNTQKNAQKGRQETGYTYVVPDQHQGQFRRLLVIGDKKGGRSSLRINHHPDLVNQLRETVRLPIKFIHVTRNPYDVITTMLGRHQTGELQDKVDFFFKMADGVAQVKSQVEPADILDIGLEAFIASPKEHLAQICRFLAVEPIPDYLQACADVVYASPHRSRDKIQWSEAWIETTQARIEHYPFLSHYTFGKPGGE